MFALQHNLKCRCSQSFERSRLQIMIGTLNCQLETQIIATVFISIWEVYLLPDTSNIFLADTPFPQKSPKDVARIKRNLLKGHYPANMEFDITISQR